MLQYEDNIDELFNINTNTNSKPNNKIVLINSIEPWYYKNDSVIPIIPQQNITKSSSKQLTSPISEDITKIQTQIIILLLIAFILIFIYKNIR